MKNSVGLTEKEMTVLQAMRNNRYGDALIDGYTFKDGIVCDLPPKSLSAVLTSLNKKGEVSVMEVEHCITVAYTEKSKQRFEI